MKAIKSLYLHFPFCKHLCNYCDFFKHVLEEETQVTKYEKILLEQWNIHKEFLKENNFTLAPLETLYLGGGTPSLWGMKGVSFLSNLISLDGLELKADCEFTLEVDPDAWKDDEIQSWKNLGVNRFSIGTQAADDKYLEVLDRKHRMKDIDKTLSYFQSMGANFSVDFLIGIPNSENRNIKKELSKLLSFNPAHISVYILKTRKNYPHIKDLPDDDFVADEYLEVCRYLEENGLIQYEVSNFSKPGFKSKHNLNYWKYKSVAAIGANGTGLLVDENQAIRYQWKSSAPELQKDIIKGSSLIIEKLFLQFRSSAGVNMDTIFKNEVDQLRVDKLLEDWRQKDYLTLGASRQKICLSPQGYLMCDSILDDIFREIDF